MRKSFLASVAVIGLTTASVAYAQQDATTTDPAAPAEQVTPMTEPEVPASGDTMGAAGNEAGGAAEQGIEGAGPTMTESDGGMGTAPTDTGAGTGTSTAQSYQPYSGQEQGSFTGTIAGDFSADELMDRNIVDMEGNNVGKVSDLLIGSDGTIQNVLVDVGGFLGIGTRTVALGLDQVQMAQGDAEDLVVNMTREQVENLPQVEEQDGTWGTMPETPDMPADTGTTAPGLAPAPGTDPAAPATTTP
ncbi:MAG TPA: PRC-barrel domain-containing protein [Geminicoccus sp.]|uniref:PRC-barrel domain-containing protein n=1 Tax=Geminicoccus sp. TaxID=2024832 RepID=UPI002C2D3F66|nr:PRC-barrel domain-containing protein [Geminicoccus sp.]HWL69486.1 PRC-barrel domain-containing protein [Geminicoccus sp.]